MLVGTPPEGKNIMQRGKWKILAQLRRLRETVFGKTILEKAWSDSALLIPEGGCKVVASLCFGNVKGVVSHDQS